VSSYYVVIMAVIAVFGLGLATVTASTSALVADLSRAEGRGGALGVLSSIMDVGHSSGPMVSGVLIGAFSYEPSFAFVGFGLVGVGIIYALGMRRLSAAVNS
jgi:DHA1 family multidrug resistance protein-like MFS transporter